jgi:DNA-binding XRE family transcriptional regulator
MKKSLKNVRTFDELLDTKYGKAGTKKRNSFERGSDVFMLSVMLRETRREAGMTQEQLAEKVGTKKSTISRLENGNVDVELSTLYKIFEDGLGMRVRIQVG